MKIDFHLLDESVEGLPMRKNHAIPTLNFELLVEESYRPQSFRFHPPVPAVFQADLSPLVEFSLDFDFQAFMNREKSRIVLAGTTEDVGFISQNDGFLDSGRLVDAEDIRGSDHEKKNHKKGRGIK